MSIDPRTDALLIDTAEHHRDLRASVGELVGSYGREYFQTCVAEDTKPTELWAELGKAGFLGSCVAAKARSFCVVAASAGKNVSMAISARVISSGVPKVMVVDMKLSTSSPSFMRNGTTTLSTAIGAARAGTG